MPQILPSRGIGGARRDRRLELRQRGVGLSLRRVDACQIVPRSVVLRIICNDALEFPFRLIHLSHSQEQIGVTGAGNVVPRFDLQALKIFSLSFRNAPESFERLSFQKTKASHFGRYLSQDLEPTQYRGLDVPGADLIQNFMVAFKSFDPILRVYSLPKIAPYFGCAQLHITKGSELLPRL